MASAPEKVKIENIDLVLRDAQVCNAQLNVLHHLLNEPNVDEKKSAEIESKCAMIFRDMMFNLYSVLDQIYYFLYCHFQNNGNVSLSKAAFQIKQPMKQDLKWSEDKTRDGQPECKMRRNDWVTEQCKKIFGATFLDRERSEVSHQDAQLVRSFQENLLHLQAIIKVDESGKEVPGPYGGPTLSRACHPMQNGAAGKLSTFNPSEISFQELTSVENMDDWNDTTVFNLLHFFRNFTTHRSLIACSIREGYLNSETREFKPKPVDENLPVPWILIAKGAWVLVPELSHLRQTEGETKFHPHPLMKVCSQALSFVKTQRHNLCSDVAGEYPYKVTGFLDGTIRFEQNLGTCEWDRANLWPLGNYQHH